MAAATPIADPSHGYRIIAAIPVSEATKVMGPVGAGSRMAGVHLMAPDATAVVMTDGEGKKYFMDEPVCHQVRCPGLAVKKIDIHDPLIYITLLLVLNAILVPSNSTRRRALT